MDELRIEDELDEVSQIVIEDCMTVLHSTRTNFGSWASGSLS
jgi:hypothetical protein